MHWLTRRSYGLPSYAIPALGINSYGIDSYETPSGGGGGGSGGNSGGGSGGSDDSFFEREETGPGKYLTFLFGVLVLCANPPFVLADVSVRSPGKVFSVVMNSNIDRSKVSQKNATKQGPVLDDPLRRPCLMCDLPFCLPEESVRSPG